MPILQGSDIHKMKESDIDDFIKGSSSALPPEIREGVSKMLKERLGVLASEKDFFDKLNFMFEEKYKTPSDIVKAMFRLAHYTLYSMLKSAVDDYEKRGASKELFLLTLVMTSSIWQEIISQQSQPIVILMQKILTDFVMKNPDTFKEAHNRFEGMLKDNEETRKKYEAGNW